MEFGFRDRKPAIAAFQNFSGPYAKLFRNLIGIYNKRADFEKNLQCRFRANGAVIRAISRETLAGAYVCPHDYLLVRCDIDRICLVNYQT